MLPATLAEFALDKRLNVLPRPDSSAANAVKNHEGMTESIAEGSEEIGGFNPAPGIAARMPPDLMPKRRYPQSFGPGEQLRESLLNVSIRS